MRATDPAASFGVWMQNDQGILGRSNRSLGFNGWIVRNEESTAVEVNANASESAIPEPSTLALNIAGGLAVLPCPAPKSFARGLDSNSFISGPARVVPGLALGAL